MHLIFSESPTHSAATESHNPVFENVFETVNSGFAQALYEDFLRDPNSVPPEWRELFEQGLQGEPPAADVLPVDRGKAETPPHRKDEDKSPPKSPAATSGSPITGPALRLLQNMEASLDLPTATSFREIEVTRLWDFRKFVNGEIAARKLKLSFTHIIGWAIVRACEQFPSMISAVLDTEDGPHRTQPDAVNFGLAVDVERKDGSRGLMVPILKAADTMTFAEYHREYERLVAGARASKLMPDAYMGGTITLTKKGQGSIIASGTIRELAGRRLMMITSTYDHRIIQGAESGLFLQYVDALLQGEHRFYDEIAEEMGAEWESGRAVAAASAPATTALAPAPGGVPAEQLYHVAAAMSLVRAHRTHGYLAAQLDPLGTAPRGDPALDPESLDLTPDIMRALPAPVFRTYVGGETLADILPRLRETYCGTIAYEIEHISIHEERVWLRRVIESGEHRTPLTDEEKKRLLGQLTCVDVLERFLHKNYLGHKRFGIEGLDMLVPMLHATLDVAFHDGLPAGRET